MRLDRLLQCKSSIVINNNLRNLKCMWGKNKHYLIKPFVLVESKSHFEQLRDDRIYNQLPSTSKLHTLFSIQKNEKIITPKIEVVQAITDKKKLTSTSPCYIRSNEHSLPQLQSDEQIDVVEQSQVFKKRTESKKKSKKYVPVYIKKRLLSQMKVAKQIARLIRLREKLKTKAMEQNFAAFHNKFAQYFGIPTFLMNPQRTHQANQQLDKDESNAVSEIRKPLQIYQFVDGSQETNSTPPYRDKKTNRLVRV